MTDRPLEHAPRVRHAGKLHPGIQVNVQQEILDSICLSLGQMKVIHALSELGDLCARVGLVQRALLFDLKDVGEAVGFASCQH